MSGKRRAGGPTRQLSLQQSSRRPLKKQASEDTSRPQVHGRGFKWDTQSDTSLTVLANSISSSGTTVTQERKPPAKPREAQPSIVRPRPVKIAWSERRQLSQDIDNSVGVEVVAQRCKGQPRPVTAKPARSNLLSVQNDTILYSREQLAERLRVAWRERQETRPNLDIFLAHNSLDHGVNDEDILASSRDCASSVTSSPVPTIVKQNDDKLYTFPSGAPAVQVTFPVTSFTKDPKQKQLLDLSKTIVKHSMCSNESSFDKKNVDIFSKTCLLNNNLDEGFSNIFVQKDLNISEIERQMNFHIETKAVAVKSVSEITISITPEDNNYDTDDNYCNNDGINSVEDCPSSPTSKKNNLNEIELSYSNSDRKSTKETTPVSTGLDISLQCNKPSVSASVRRVNFKNSSKATIFGSLSVPCTPPATPIPGSAGNKPLSARRQPHPLTRMMSAPANSRSTPKVTPAREKHVDPNSPISTDLTVEITSDEVDYDPDDCLLSRNDRERNIKSAPARRRFKSARRKGIRGRDENYSTDEEMTCEDKPRSKRGSSRCSSDKSVDIVTMVSLLSPNESDIEDEPCDPVLQLLNDTPRVCEEKEDPPNSTVSKQNPTADAGALKTAGIFCLRKSPKTGKLFKLLITLFSFFFYLQSVSRKYLLWKSQKGPFLIDLSI